MNSLVQLRRALLNDYPQIIQWVNSGTWTEPACASGCIMTGSCQRPVLIHLSKIIHHNEEKRPLLNNVKNSDLDPLSLYLVIVLHRDWKTSHGVMKSCEEANYPSQKPHRKKGKKTTVSGRQQGLLFVPLSMTQCRTPPHNGLFLQWVVCLYQAHFVLCNK